MGRYLPFVVVALLTIYCVVEVAQAQPYAVRRMPRWLWATAVICLPLAGAVSWLFLGRPNAESLGTKKLNPTDRRHPTTTWTSSGALRACGHAPDPTSAGGPPRARGRWGPRAESCAARPLSGVTEVVLRQSAMRPGSRVPLAETQATVGRASRRPVASGGPGSSGIVSRIGDGGR